MSNLVQTRGIFILQRLEAVDPKAFSPKAGAAKNRALMISAI